MHNEYADFFNKKGQILDERVEDLLVEIESGKHIFHSPSTQMHCNRCALTFDHDRCPRCQTWQVVPALVMYASRGPTGHEQAQARIIFTRRLAEAKGRGILCRSELENLAVEQGLFEEAEREEKRTTLLMIEKKIKARDLSGDRSQKLQLDAELEQMRKRVLEITIGEATVFRNSAEAVAEEFRTNFFVTACTTAGEMLDQRAWSSINEFEHCDDEILVGNARHALLRISNGLPTRVIRAIARADSWKFKWKTCKGTHSAPFDGSLSTWDQNKINLIYWSDFYDCVNQHPDRPDDEIIADDHLLGEWLTQLAKKIKQRRSQAGTGSGGPSRRPVTYKDGAGRTRVMHHLGSKKINLNQPFKIRSATQE